MSDNQDPNMPLPRYCQLIRSKEAYYRVKKRKERREQPGAEDVQELANQFYSGYFIPSLESAL